MKEPNLHDIKDEQIISKEDGKVVLEFVIPKKWRFVEKLPVDVQGKKHKLEIMAMFEEGTK